MTNQEKNLQNAREYLNQYPGIDGLDVDELDFNERDWLLKFLSDYPEWLEQKGVVKFTDNRFNQEKR